MGPPCHTARTGGERFHQAEAGSIDSNGRPPCQAEGRQCTCHQYQGWQSRDPRFHGRVSGAGHGGPQLSAQEVTRINGYDADADEDMPRGKQPSKTKEGRRRDRLGEANSYQAATFYLGRTGHLPNGIREWPKRTFRTRKVTWNDGWEDSFEEVLMLQSHPCNPWDHSVTTEKDFKSPWVARNQALLLRADLDGLFDCEYDDDIQAFRVQQKFWNRDGDQEPSDQFMNSMTSTERRDGIFSFVPNANGPDVRPTNIDVFLGSEMINNDREFENKGYLHSALPHPKRQRIEEGSVVEDHPIEEWQIQIEDNMRMAPRTALSAHLSFQTIHAIQQMTPSMTGRTTIITYGLLVTCQGRRTTYVDGFAPQQITMAVQQVWQDYAGFDAEVILVQPQPHNHDDPTFLVVFDTENPPFPQAMPVLQQVIWEDYLEQPMRTDECAAYLMQNSHFSRSAEWPLWMATT